MIEKFIPCRKCKEIKDNNLFKPAGYYFKKIERGGQEHSILVECDHFSAWKKRKELHRKLHLSGFNTEFIDYNAETDYKGKKSMAVIYRIINYTRLFETAGENREKAKRSILYFYGDNGTQKTTVANYVGRRLIENGMRTKYILMKSLVDKLWKSQRDEAAQHEIEELTRCDVLVVDEAFAKDKIHVWSSGSQIGYVDEFLRERINNGCGTIFISNILPNTIEDQGFSHSIQDLVLRELKKQNGLMEFKDNYFDSVSEDEIPDSLF